MIIFRSIQASSAFQNASFHCSSRPELSCRKAPRGALISALLNTVAADITFEREKGESGSVTGGGPISGNSWPLIGLKALCQCSGEVMELRPLSKVCWWWLEANLGGREG